MPFRFALAFWGVIFFFPEFCQSVEYNAIFLMKSVNAKSSVWRFGLLAAVVAPTASVYR